MIKYDFFKSTSSWGISKMACSHSKISHEIQSVESKSITVPGIKCFLALSNGNFAFGHENGFITIWRKTSPDTADCLYSIDVINKEVKEKAEVTRLQELNNNRIVASLQSDDVYVFDLLPDGGVSHKVISFEEENDGVFDGCFSVVLNGQFVAARRIVYSNDQKLGYHARQSHQLEIYNANDPEKKVEIKPLVKQTKFGNRDVTILGLSFEDFTISHPSNYLVCNAGNYVFSVKIDEMLSSENVKGEVCLDRAYSGYCGYFEALPYDRFAAKIENQNAILIYDLLKKTTLVVDAGVKTNLSPLNVLACGYLSYTNNDGDIEILNTFQLPVSCMQVCKIDDNKETFHMTLADGSIIRYSNSVHTKSAATTFSFFTPLSQARYEQSFNSRLGESLPFPPPILRIVSGYVGSFFHDKKRFQLTAAKEKEGVKGFRLA